MTPPHNKSPSFELIQSLKSARSQSDCSEYIPSPPMTNYASSSSYSVVHVSDSDSKMQPLPGMGTLSSASQNSLQVSVGMSRTLMTTDMLGMTESSSFATKNFDF